MGAALRGLSLRLRHQEVSVSDKFPSFRIELLPALTFEEEKYYLENKILNDYEVKEDYGFKLFLIVTTIGIRDGGERLDLEAPE